MFQTFTSKIPVPVSGYPFFLRKQIQKTIQNSTKKPKQQNQKKWHAKCHQADRDKDHCQDQYKTDDISQNLYAVFPPLLYQCTPGILLCLIFISVENQRGQKLLPPTSCHSFTCPAMRLRLVWSLHLPLPQNNQPL